MSPDWIITWNHYFVLLSSWRKKKNTENPCRMKLTLKHQPVKSLKTNNIIYKCIVTKPDCIVLMFMKFPEITWTIWFWPLQLEQDDTSLPPFQVPFGKYNQIHLYWASVVKAISQPSSYSAQYSSTFTIKIGILITVHSHSQGQMPQPL